MDLETGTFKYKLKDIQKLRSASTDEEKQAFLWFVGEFVESVAGRKTWGKQKYLKLMSEPTREGGKPIVSVSDEAFALLMLDNYYERWIKERMERFEKSKQLTPDKKFVRGRKGKYTAPKNGNREYRGWSNEGILEYGRLLKMVRNSRQEDVEEKKMEKWVRQQIRGTRKGPWKQGGDEDNDDDSMVEKDELDLFNEAEYDE